jgi:hypothetical protein
VVLEDEMNGVELRIWKEIFAPYFKVLFSLYLERLRNTMKTSVRSTGKD